MRLGLATLPPAAWRATHTRRAAQPHRLRNTGSRCSETSSFGANTLTLHTHLPCEEGPCSPGRAGR